MPEHDERRSPPRGLWTGTLAFGLVSVPVHLFAANRSNRVSLRMVDEEGTPLQRLYYCPKDDVPLDADEIVRGYEVDDDRFVVVEDEELEALAPEKSQEIELERFVELDAIDPVYFERAYFLAPGSGGVRAYRLLTRAMEEAGRVGVATFVMRGREYLVAILADGGFLRAETLRFHDEIRTPEAVGLSDLEDPSDDRVDAMESDARSVFADTLDRGALSDPSTDRLHDLVDRKLEAGEDVVTAPESIAPSTDESDQIVDLMKVLKQSLRESEQETVGGDGLDDRTKDELYDRARELDISGRSDMTKDELIDAIREAS